MTPEITKRMEDAVRRIVKVAVQEKIDFEDLLEKMATKAEAKPQVIEKLRKRL